MSITAATLNAMSDEQLRELNHQVVAVMRHRHSVKAMTAVAAFRPGDKVQFTGKYGEKLTATVDKINQKTVSVTTTDGGRWKVSAGLLSKLA